MYKSFGFPLIKYNYSIHRDGNHIGSDMITKKPRLGETWLRGRDLKDGKLTLNTIFGILKDIAYCELSLGRFQRNTKKG